MEYGEDKEFHTEKEHDVVNIYQTLNYKNKHKMVPIPILIKQNKFMK
mgnify:CR=1 FL=1